MLFNQDSLTDIAPRPALANICLYFTLACCSLLAWHTYSAVPFWSNTSFLLVKLPAGTHLGGLIVQSEACIYVAN